MGKHLDPLKYCGCSAILFLFSLQDLKGKLLLEAEEAKTELQSRLNDAHHKLSDTQVALTEAEAALSETQCRLEELQRSRDQDIKSLEKELNQALTDRDAAARECHLNHFLT